MTLGMMILGVALALGAAVACDGDAAVTGAHRRGGAELGGSVVSTVQGHAITLDEVTNAARDLHLSPGQALNRLQTEKLLALEAERRGVDPGSKGAWVVAQAAVQEVLAREVEGQVSPADIAPADVEAAYAAQIDRFVRGERRWVVHALVPVEQGAGADTLARAGALAETIRRDALEQEDPAEALAALGDTSREGFVLVAEELHDVAAEGIYEQSFVRAAFALQAPGDVSLPVETSYGLHVIALTAIEPPRDVAFAAAEPDLREEMLVQARHQRLLELLEDAADRHVVAVREEGWAVVEQLDMDRLLARGSATGGAAEER